MTATVAGTRDAFTRLLGPLDAALTPDAARVLAGLRADPGTQDRLDDLADRYADGLLAGDELDEYDDLVRGAALISVLQAKARGYLARHAAP